MWFDGKLNLKDPLEDPGEKRDTFSQNITSLWFSSCRTSLKPNNLRLNRWRTTDELQYLVRPGLCGLFTPTGLWPLFHW